MPDLPTGTVTFLFTDVEGSTRLLQEDAEAYPDILARHNRILRDAIAAGDGVEVQTEGDAFFAAFPTPSGALRAAVQAQRVLSSERWPAGKIIRVRMGVHTGEGAPGADGYVGLDVHRAARIAAAGHGAQVLISDATRGLVAHALPEGVSLRDLGEHRLKDIERLEHLYQVLVDGLPQAFPPIRTLSARLSNLPEERDSFVGRERELATISDLLGRTRLLTLTGAGGIGKTRLALKIAADQIGRFADGVYLADLSPVTDPDLVPGVIATSLMVREQAGGSMLDSLADYLRDREVLLLLDNVEQVMEAASGVGRLIEAASGLKVLATSRTPLHLTGEQEFPVPPLALPDPAGSADPERLKGNEAVTLFLRRAAAVRPGLVLTAETAPAIAQIARDLDGLPLAIELAASRAKALAPDAILARLATRLSLTTAADDRPERHRTLRNTIEWSHDLLDAKHRRLFARLGTFSGGWTLEAAERICGPGLDLDVLDGLANLVDHSLVRPMGAGHGNTRFTMLETIRDSAVERLAASGDDAAVRQRHAETFRDLAEDAERQLTRQDRVAWLGRLEEEHGNLRAALDWSERIGDSDMGLRIGAAIWRFWQQQGHLTEGRARLERLLAMQGADVRGPERVRALAALGGVSYWQNDPSMTRAAYEEAVAIARELGDTALLASALYDLSFVPHLERNSEAVEPILLEGLAAAQQSGDRVLIAEYLSGIAFLDVDRGNPAGAIEPYRTAVRIFREEGETWKAADLLTGLGMIIRMTGDAEAAAKHLVEALQTFGEAKDELSMSMAFTGLALIAIDEGLNERAARLVGIAARMRHEVGGTPPLIGRWGDPEHDARMALGEEAYIAARAEGYAMDTEAAEAYAIGSKDQVL
ncbi:MAG: adenylate/guanylate cyclase domain-containing protein [Chloroflexota bacterium]|nr:adenylate/guanylate cyclase domain-containing protein [Chloroflexota bacterium]